MLARVGIKDVLETSYDLGITTLDDVATETKRITKVVDLPLLPVTPMTFRRREGQPKKTAPDKASIPWYQGWKKSKTGRLHITSMN